MTAVEKLPDDLAHSIVTLSKEIWHYANDYDIEVDDVPDPGECHKRVSMKSPEEIADCGGAWCKAWVWVPISNIAEKNPRYFEEDKDGEYVPRGEA